MMKHKLNIPKHLLAWALVGAFAAGPVMAEKPSWSGGSDNREKQQDRHQNAQSEDRGRSEHDREDDQIRMRGYFGDGHRTTAHRVYSEEYSRGNCPPGLAKKNNGCMPPGQAKKWAYGQPLSSDVDFYDLSPELIREFGPPPPGYRYVRVSGDLLLLTTATGLVVDAIMDLGGM